MCFHYFQIVQRQMPAYQGTLDCEQCIFVNVASFVLRMACHDINTQRDRFLVLSLFVIRNTFILMLGTINAAHCALPIFRSPGALHFC